MCGRSGFQSFTTAKSVFTELGQSRELHKHELVSEILVVPE